MPNHNITPSNDSSSPPPPNELPPSADATHTSNNSTNNSEDQILKTPWQVLQELCGSSSDDDGEDGGSVGGKTSVAMAASAAIVGGDGGGGLTVVEGVVGAPVEEEKPVKRRKTSIVRDPPSGKPICPDCSREFASWKAVFGHMRAHPNRDYRGLFKPPVFGSSSSTKDQPPSEGDSAKKSVDEDNNGEKVSATSDVKMLSFDLNEPLPEEEEEPSVAAKPAEENNVVEDGNGLKQFDLNEVPFGEDLNDA